MATYEDLRAYFDESGEMRRLVQEAVTIPIVSGITIDLNPFWVAALDHEDGLTTWGELRQWHEFYDQDDGWRGFTWPPAPWKFRQGYRRRDLNRKPKEPFPWGSSDWSRNPVVLTIAFNMPTPKLDGDEATSELEPPEEALRRLSFLVNRSSFARIEERAIPSLSGRRIKSGSGKTGTLGGVLSNASGAAWGMTCAHVARKGEVVSNGHTPLGVCLADTPRFPIPQGCLDPSLLPPPDPSPGNGPVVNMLDLALVAMTAAPSGGSLGGVAAYLTPGQAVQIIGSRSRVKATLGSLAIAYVFRDGGVSYAFRDCIELVPEPILPLGGRLGALVRRSPPKPGESGSWVVTRDASPLWAGVFFGADESRGFAVRASWAHAWAEQQAGAGLMV